MLSRNDELRMVYRTETQRAAFRLGGLVASSFISSQGGMMTRYTLIVGLLIISAAVSEPSQAGQATQLRVASVSCSPDDKVAMTLTNEGSRAIVAFVLQLRAMSGTQTLAISIRVDDRYMTQAWKDIGHDQGRGAIGAGESVGFVERFVAPAGTTSCQASPLGVILDNGSTAGVGSAIGSIFRARERDRAAMERWLPVLRSARDAAGSQNARSGLTSALARARFEPGSAQFALDRRIAAHVEKILADQPSNDRRSLDLWVQLYEAALRVATGFHGDSSQQR